MEQRRNWINKKFIRKGLIEMIKQVKKISSKEIRKINKLKRSIKNGQNVEMNLLKLQTLEDKYNYYC